MESLLETLALSDLEIKLQYAKTCVANMLAYRHQMRAFSALLSKSTRLPVASGKYTGKIMHVAFILRRKRLYVSLNCSYDKHGNLKHIEAASQQGGIVKLRDIENIRTLDGRKFRTKYVYNSIRPVRTVMTNRVFVNEKIKIIENGLEHFPLRDKLIKKFGLQPLFQAV